VAEDRKRQKVCRKQNGAVRSSRRYETEGGRSLMQAAIVIWILINLPRIGTQ
jgi:hypothetical protein